METGRSRTGRTRPILVEVIAAVVFTVSSAKDAFGPRRRSLPALRAGVVSARDRRWIVRRSTQHLPMLEQYGRLCRRLSSCVSVNSGGRLLRVVLFRRGPMTPL